MWMKSLTRKYTPPRAAVQHQDPCLDRRTPDDARVHVYPDKMEEIKSVEAELICLKGVFPPLHHLYCDLNTILVMAVTESLKST